MDGKGSWCRPATMIGSPHRQISRPPLIHAVETQGNDSVLQWKYKAQTVSYLLIHGPGTATAHIKYGLSFNMLALITSDCVQIRHRDCAHHPCAPPHSGLRRGQRCKTIRQCFCVVLLLPFLL